MLFVVCCEMVFCVVGFMFADVDCCRLLLSCVVAVVCCVLLLVNARWLCYV